LISRGVKTPVKPKIISGYCISSNSKRVTCLTVTYGEGVSNYFIRGIKAKVAFFSEFEVTTDISIRNFKDVA
jgi:hypothetical protein